jgi:lysophospholipase L1-like esterase
MDPAPFLRGVAFPGNDDVPYPRAKLDDAFRLPLDTWAQAQIPVGVRLELVGDAESIEIQYVTVTDSLGYRGAGAGTSFAVWRDGAPVQEGVAALGEGRVVLQLGDGDGRVIVYLPEGMKPRVLSIDAVGGAIGPAPQQPRWIAYGDSIVEGWCATSPALAWPAVAGRDHELDHANLGYAGAARGEIVSATEIAKLPADVITIAHGTNCWTRIPHSVEQMRANIRAFLDVLRQGHPETPILVVSPVIRPDAETKPNRLGATLADLRAAIEEVANERIDAGDKRLRLVEGAPLLTEPDLFDGIHPNDDGHRAIAAAIGPALKDLLEA